MRSSKMSVLVWNARVAIRRPCLCRHQPVHLCHRDPFTSPSSGLVVVPLDAAILVEAARLRAMTPSLYLPDAIHLAAAEAGRLLHGPDDGDEGYDDDFPP